MMAACETTTKQKLDELLYNEHVRLAGISETLDPLIDGLTDEANEAAYKVIRWLAMELGNPPSGSMRAKCS
jgi:hypothetical protein